MQYGSMEVWKTASYDMNLQVIEIYFEKNGT